MKLTTTKLADYRAYDVDSKLFHHVYADASWYGDRDKRVQAVCGATAKGLPVRSAIEGARLERIGATSCPGCEVFTDRRSIWTIAFRKRRANRFQRVTNWSGSWDDAVKMAGLFAESHPELEIYYVITLDAEKANPNSEDNGNVMVESGKRIRIVDNAELSDEIISEFVRVTGRVENKGRPGHFYKTLPNTDNHIICTHKSHVTNGAAYACANDAIWANGAYAQKEIEKLDALDHGHVVEVMSQVVNNGREDLTYLFDSIDVAPFQEPTGEDSVIPSVTDCEKCCHYDTSRCDACVLAWLVSLYHITGDVKLNELPAVAEFDCYA